MTDSNTPQESPQAATSTTSTTSNVSFEAALEQLQAAVKRLESGELNLEESLKQFEEGVRLTRNCQEQLSAAEKRVELLMKSNADGSVELQPFAPQRS